MAFTDRARWASGPKWQCRSAAPDRSTEAVIARDGSGVTSVSASDRPAAPAPGEAPMPAPNAAALLRRNASTFANHPALRFEGQVWNHRAYVEEACRWAN